LLWLFDKIDVHLCKKNANKLHRTLLWLFDKIDVHLCKKNANKLHRTLLWLFDVWIFDMWLFDMWLFVMWLFVMWLFDKIDVHLCNKNANTPLLYVYVPYWAAVVACGYKVIRGVRPAELKCVGGCCVLCGLRVRTWQLEKKIRDAHIHESCCPNP
jgi:hypothetical protein